VKLTPGTGKRGKACKTALAIFIGDKATSQRSGIEKIYQRMYLYVKEDKSKVSSSQEPVTGI
jgi:hypothetical protein